MVPTFTMESIDEGGARLDPDSIATPTPQFFDVASPPDRQTGFGGMRCPELLGLEIH